MQVELRVGANLGSGNATSVPEWLDDDFLQLCMQSGEGDPTIRVLNYKVSVFRKPKTDHSTTMYKVSVEFKRRPRSRNILDFKPQEVRWLIIKTLIQSNDSKEARQNCAIFDKEIVSLSTTLPSISKLLGLFPLSAQCFYSEKSPRALIVMEDLSKNDFIQGKMERGKGLDFDHCLLVLQSMAAFHAGSVALFEKNKSSMDPYEFNMWTEENNGLVEELIYTAVTDVADEVSTWSNFGDKYSERIRALKHTLVKKVYEAVARNQSGFNVLNHGHCWYNNLLFRYNNNATGMVKEVLFVDFRNNVFGSPAIDLQHFLYSTPTDEVRLQNFNRLILHYHRELVSNLEKLGVKIKPPTKEELIREIDERGAYSVLVAFTLLPIVVNENPTNTDILSDKGSKIDKSKMYASEPFKVSIKRLLQIFDSKGYLD